MPASSPSPYGTATCPVCGTTFPRAGRRIWCSDACKQTAWRRRHPPAPPPALPPPALQRDHTVYECAQCGRRQTGRQWCEDCSRPCRRVGPGGDCPQCGTPVTFSDLVPGT